MRASRLMALLLTLQRRGSATAPALARELEVSVRTIYRDVAALQAAGVPLWTEPGAGGGIRMVEGWRTDLDGLTGAEATALFLSGAPAVATQLGLGALLVAAEAKVLTTLPPEVARRARQVRERFHLDAPGWYHHPDSTEHLGVVAEALWSCRRLRVRYRRGSGEVERTLEPLGLVCKAGTWYLVAAVPGDGGVLRTYRVGRIVGVEATDVRFARPEGFDLAAHWAEASEAFDVAMLPERCRLRLSPAAARLLPLSTGRRAAGEALAAAGPPDAQGWVTVDLAVESEEVALHQLLVLGAGIEVLAPASLRTRFHDAGLAVAARNAPRPARPPRRRALDREGGRGGAAEPAGERDGQLTAASGSPRTGRSRSSAGTPSTRR